jgi:hypothetical protein
MSSWKWVFTFSLLFITVGWAVFLVLLSSDIIVDNPPDFSEAGVGTVLGVLVSWTRTAMQNCYNTVKGG